VTGRQVRPRQAILKFSAFHFTVAFSASVRALFLKSPGRKRMVRTFIIAATSAAVLAVPLTSFAQQGQFGNADEAKAMLAKAVAAVKADKAKALDMFNKGEGGFLDRDLYPFCFNVSDGKHLATQAKQLVGQDIRILKDPTGKAFGLELYAAAQNPEGQITEVTYMFPKPVADTTPGQNVAFTAASQKVSFVIRVGDVGCAVGYFK
jgi:hypothetical protein